MYRGDVWIAPARGGRATPLTQHVDTDSYPLFSPDGRWLAFASRRNGNWDIFAVPTDGGAPRQLTWHAGNDIPQGWSPDGKQLLFAGKRDSSNYGLFTVTVGETTPSSSRLDAVIPKITDNPRRTPNLWVLDLDGQAKQLTTFTGGAVRWPAVATQSGDIAVEYEGDLYLLPGGRRRPQKLRLLVAADEKQTTRRRERLTKEVTEAEPSPDGKTLGFWVTGREGGLHVPALTNGAIRRVVKVPGPQWRGHGGGDFAWSPDMLWIADTRRGEGGQDCAQDCQDPTC